MSNTVLPDVLNFDLSVVFCGMAAGNRSAAIGAYYAGRGNKFWRVLADTGLTPTLLQPSQFRDLLNFGIGLTDVAKYASGNDIDISHSDRDPGAVRARILHYSPGILAFNGKAAAATFYNCRTCNIRYGLQVAVLGSTSIYVLPSTSGSANGYWDASYWVELADMVRGIGL